MEDLVISITLDFADSLFDITAASCEKLLGTDDDWLLLVKKLDAIFLVILSVSIGIEFLIETKFLITVKAPISKPTIPTPFKKSAIFNGTLNLL